MYFFKIREINRDFPIAGGGVISLTKNNKRKSYMRNGILGKKVITDLYCAASQIGREKILDVIEDELNRQRKREREESPQVSAHRPFPFSPSTQQ